MSNRVIGGILLVVGTSIGGGMLALPVATAASGFFASSLLLFVCWAIMTFSALLIMEVNLWLPANNNMVSMAKYTLGRPGAIAAWITYLLLLYSLLSAYISGGTDILHGILEANGLKQPLWMSSIIFVLVFGYIVYRGIKPVDYVNRALMITKLGALLILISFTLPYLDLNKLAGGEPKYLISTVTVMITSFGFATIAPSLRTYYDGDVKKLRKAILIGSLIPLVCYILWDFAILGTLPKTGPNGLLQMMQSGHENTDLMNSLSYYLHNTSVTIFSHIFTSICVLTSFLGVSLGLSDFLADGLKITKQGKGNFIIAAATFLPPLAIILFFPGIFIKALSYAGIFCVILLVLLPSLMVWSGRYIKKFATGYQVVGGKLSIVIILLLSLLIISIGLLQLPINM